MITMLLTSSSEEIPSLPFHSVKQQKNDACIEVSERSEFERTAFGSFKAKVIADDRGDAQVCLDAESVALSNVRSSRALSRRQADSLDAASVARTERDGLQALCHAARTNARWKARSGISNQKTPAAGLRESSITAYASLAPAQTKTFAAPVSPLRARDCMALAGLFERNDIHALEADVSQRLLALLPEPCWEDDVFDFLKEFL